MTNPILKELHDIRKQILAEHGDDLGEYLACSRKDEGIGPPCCKDQAENHELHRSGQ